MKKNFITTVQATVLNHQNSTIHNGGNSSRNKIEKQIQAAAEKQYSFYSCSCYYMKRLQGMFSKSTVDIFIPHTIRFQHNAYTWLELLNYVNINSSIERFF